MFHRVVTVSVLMAVTCRTTKEQLPRCGATCQIWKSFKRSKICEIPHSPFKFIQRIEAQTKWTPFCRRHIQMHFIQNLWFPNEILSKYVPWSLKCDNINVTKFHFSKKYKTLSNNLWSYIKELHKRHYITGKKLFSTGDLGKNKLSQTPKWVEIYAEVSTSIIVATTNLTWKAFFEKHIPMYILYNGYLSSMILVQMCPVAYVMCCRLCYVHMCIKTHFSMLSNF